jgi:iron complex transport system substrate-binding protein
VASKPVKNARRVPADSVGHSLKRALLSPNAILFLFLSLSCAPAHAFDRVVSLAPVLSEWTAEILGQARSEKVILGVSEYSNYPEYLKSIPTVGAYFKLNIEKIAALKPDLIIASSEYNRPEQLEQLKRLKLPIEILPKEKFSEMPAWIEHLGAVLGEKAAGEKLSKRWKSEVAALAASAKKKKSARLFLEVQHSPLVTIGGDSFLNDAFSLVGYENIFKSLSQSYPKVSKESVLKENPEVVFILDLTGNPKDFEPARLDWEKYGKHPKIVSGDDFARCSFLLLKGLRSL